MSNTTYIFVTSPIVPPGSGFTGTSNPEPGGTIGDVTKMYVVFDIYSGTSCGSSGPAATTAPVQVSDGLTVNDGIGTATATYSSSSESSYCVVARLVGSTGGTSTNLYYKAHSAQAAE